MRSKAIVLPLALALVLALTMVLGICAITYADEEMSTGQGMSETVSDNGAEEDSGNGGDAGPADEEDSGNGGNAGPADEEDSDAAPSETIDEGEEKNVILIRTAEELYSLAGAVNGGTFVQSYEAAISNAVVRLANDINLSGAGSGGSFTPIGNVSHAFRGEFDGDGYTISGLTINRDSEPLSGLFGILGKGAYVHDVKLTGVKIRGLALVGGIAGFAEFADIKNCSVEGTIYASDSLAGGIVGVALESRIESCKTSGNVTAEIENAGGIAGQAGYSNGLISNCSSSMTVTVPWGAGGIAGSVINAEVAGGGFTGKLVCMSEASGSMVGDIMDVEMDAAEVASEYETANDANENAPDGNSQSPSMPIDVPGREPGEAGSDETGVSTDVI